MKITVMSHFMLNDYVPFLEKYAFQATKYSKFPKGEVEHTITEGTIELSSLEELFELAEMIRGYFLDEGCRADDAFVITYEQNKWVLEVYDTER